MTTGTRTSSSIVPSLGLRVNTSMPPSVSAAGGVNVALTLNVPRAGAPALAMVFPVARTVPPPSTMRHCSVASKTLASPLIVTGEVMRVFVVFTVGRKSGGMRQQMAERHSVAPRIVPTKLWQDGNERCFQL